MTICFDIDGVLCSQVEAEYSNAIPNPEVIALVNRLYLKGFRIILSTSRFMGRTNGNVLEAYRMGYEFTRRQLEQWGVQYHELHLGKPACDLVVDDRAAFFDPDPNKLEALIDLRASSV